MDLHHDIAWLTARPIAHRGLHDEARGIHENSLSAFQAALDGGYAIECDLHLSADGVPMVFHDGDLKRMTGSEGPFSALTAAELAELRLKGSDDTIPTFADLLRLVAGRTPIIVELKGTDPAADAGFAAALQPLLDAYHGPLALMSFDSWLVEQAGAFAHRFPVGLTAEGTRSECFERHRQVFGDLCSFASYNFHHLPNPFTRWVREEKGLPVISWTVRTVEDEARSTPHADQITFEGFVPQGSQGCG